MDWNVVILGVLAIVGMAYTAYTVGEHMVEKIDREMGEKIRRMEADMRLMRTDMQDLVRQLERLHR